MFCRLIILLAIFTTVLLAPVGPLKAENPYILIDGTSGKILAGNKIHDKWHPASLTKLMTAWVTFQAIRRNELKPGSPVIISHAATKQPPSRMGYKKGVKLRIDTALKIIIVKSANDVSVALAEAVAGSMPKFVNRMNAEARRLGLTRTRFTNSNGLHSSAQTTSARDMALLSMRLRNDFPQFAYMFKAAAIQTAAKTHYSYNLLLERFRGANGMKTGFVCASGYNMVASATRNGHSLIAVVLGTASQTERAVRAAKLLTEGFSGQASGNGSVFVQPASGTGKRAKNMRPILCTQKARAARYDPGAGEAKIKSKYLNPRHNNGKILQISTGGVDAKPSEAYANGSFGSPIRIPVPTKRPIFKTPVIKTIDGLVRGAENYLPVPTPRPRG